MLKTIRGIYKDGQIHLTELPQDVSESQVLVTFLDPSKIDPAKLLETIAGIGQGFEELERDQTSLMEFIEIEGSVDPTKPLIYLWEILDSDGKVCYWYVGKASGGANRPRNHYRRNVNNLLLGYPYRRNKPDEFRFVHRELAEAVKSGQAIRLSFLCNVSPQENIDVIERKWQQHYGLVLQVNSD
jgi:hypothetical protein